MPEGLEAEIWRRSIEPMIGHVVTDIWADERVADPGLRALIGGTIEAVTRRGKVVLLLIAGDELGLHFGMTGRVVVDGAAPIETLAYSSSRDRPEWDILRMFTDRSRSDPATNVPHTPGIIPALRVNDPRRLGHISLDADLSALGVDIFAVTPDSLAEAFGSRRAAIKTVLLNQSVLAGLGNLCADEVLWWARIDPHRLVNSLTPDEVESLAAAIQQRLPVMLERGGSTAGELDPALRSGPGECPRDGAPLQRSTIGGRTAVWCQQHQR